MGAGRSTNECKVLHHLKTLLGKPVTYVALFDDSFISDSLHNIEAYSSTLPELHPRPCMLFNIRDVQYWLQEDKRKSKTRQHITVIVAINSGLYFSSSKELYAWHKFLCASQQLADQGFVHGKYLKFSCGPDRRSFAKQIESSNVWLWEESFWDMAVDIFTDKTSQKLLVGT